MLYELRRIVLGEFMEDLELGDILSDSFGIGSRDESATEEKLGEDRLG